MFKCCKSPAFGKKLLLTFVYVVCIQCPSGFPRKQRLICFGAVFSSSNYTANENCNSSLPPPKKKNIMLMVQKSWDVYIKPCKFSDILPYQLVCRISEPSKRLAIGYIFVYLYIHIIFNFLAPIPAPIPPQR